MSARISFRQRITKKKHVFFSGQLNIVALVLAVATTSENKCCEIMLKELLGTRIFNFKNLLYMKLYILLILNKIQKPDNQHLRRHDQSNHLTASIAAALNTSLIGL